MPHLRKRHIEALLLQSLKESSIVGLLGHRQVGKTTLIEPLCQPYLTLDQSDVLRAAQETPVEWLKQAEQHHSRSVMGVDECQKAPALFPALKEWVRTHKRTGQFLLSGSVRFTSQKVIQESLTGRILNLELLPFLVCEANQLPLSDALSQLMKATRFNESLLRKLSEKVPQAQANRMILRFFETGGLPGVCFLRNAASRQRRLKDQLRTLLERDLKQVLPTTLADYRIFQVVQGLAAQQGEDLNMSAQSREFGVSIPTLQKLMYAFESLFLLRLLPTEGDVRAPSFYFEDVAEASLLAGVKASPIAVVRSFLFHHLRGQIQYRIQDTELLSAQVFRYCTRGGAEVPLAVRAASGCVGFVLCDGVVPTRSEIASGASFLKTYAQAKVVYTHLNSQAQVLNDRELVLPLRGIVF